MKVLTVLPDVSVGSLSCVNGLILISCVQAITSGAFLQFYIHMFVLSCKNFV